MWQLKHNSGYSLFFENQENDSFYRKAYHVFVNGEVYAENLRQNTFSIFQSLTGKINVQIINQDKEIEYQQEILLEDKNFYLNVNDYLAHLTEEDNHSIHIQGLILSSPENTTLYFPARKYNITSLFLKSDIKLVFEEGAVFNVLYDLKQFPVLPGLVEDKHFDKSKMVSTWEGNPQACYSSIISGYNLKNVEVIGRLKIQANASHQNWWQDCKKKKVAWRPKTLYLNNCQEFTIHGLEIYNSPSWSIHPFYSDDINFFDTFIFNPSDSPNTDGINPESCQRIEINGCNFDVGDDCIAIKSGKIYSSKYHYRACENISIKNCKMEHGHGAIVLGSEISSGVKHLNIENCFFSNTDRGLRVKTRRGRGHLSVIDDIRLENIEMEEVKAPFTINAYYNCDPDGNSDYVSDRQAYELDDRTPTLGNFYFKNITCKKVHQVICMSYGLAELPIKSVNIENSQFEFVENPEKGVPLMMRDEEEVVNFIYKFLNVETVTLKNNKYLNSDPKNVQFEGIANLEEVDNEYC